MSLVEPMSFSPSGEYLAHSGADGTLRIFHASTGDKLQEYTPSSHLSASCSCLSWSPLEEVVPRKKRKPQPGLVTGHQTDLIAIGTTSGNILLYSLSKGDLCSHLNGGHSSTVHCVCWGDDTLYSCSDDQHIIEWSISTSSVRHRWRGDKGMIYSISLCHSKKHLLSAGRKIKLWDLVTKEVLQVFSGHATEIFSVISVQTPSHCKIEDPIEGSYFLSAATGERLINAWQIDTTTQEKSALAKFLIPDEAVFLNFCSPSVKNEAFVLIAVTKTGQVIVYEHVLNGKCKNPLKPRGTLHVVSTDDPPKPLQIRNAMVTPDRMIIFSYGSFIKPTIGQISLSSINDVTCLSRSDPEKLLVQLESNMTKVKTPAISEELKVLYPSHSGSNKPIIEELSAKKKRRKSLEMTMEERLNAISIEQPAKSILNEPPRANTLATLLAQGLQSGDKKILNNVLQNSNETILRNTIKRLPVPVIVPLVQELSNRMQGHAQSGHIVVRWIKMVLTIHTSFLMTFPQLVDKLGHLYQIMDARVTMFGKLSRLQGKLDLMLSQITLQNQTEEETGTTQQAMLIYQDESSDEDFGVDDLNPDLSDSEDNWEDLSDLDNNNAHETSGSEEEMIIGT